MIVVIGAGVFFAIVFIISIYVVVESEFDFGFVGLSVIVFFASLACFALAYSENENYTKIANHYGVSKEEIKQLSEEEIRLLKAIMQKSKATEILKNKKILIEY